MCNFKSSLGEGTESDQSSGSYEAEVTHAAAIDSDNPVPSTITSNMLSITGLCGWPRAGWIGRTSSSSSTKY